MKTPQVQRKIEGSANPFQSGRVLDEEIRLDTGRLDFLLSALNSPGSEVNTGDPPSGVGESDDVCAGATPDVNGPAGFMALDKVDKFWWANACIPRRLPKVPILKKETADQIFHVFL